MEEIEFSHGPVHVDREEVRIHTHSSPLASIDSLFLVRGHHERSEHLIPFSSLLLTSSLLAESRVQAIGEEIRTPEVGKRSYSKVERLTVVVAG